MKKGNRIKDLEKHDLSEDSEPDYHQYGKNVEDTCSLVDISDNCQSPLQIKSRLLHRYNGGDSDSDCMQKVQYNKKNKEVCGYKEVCRYCRKGIHSLNDCPLFTNAVQQQSKMLCTYNTSSTNHHKQKDQFPYYDETEMTKHELRQKTQREYFRKHDNSDTEACNGTDPQYLKFLQKAQEEYYSKRCKYCNEYGHQESTCAVLEKRTLRHDDSWTDIKAKKSKKSKKNKVLQIDEHDLSEIDHNASDCVKETKENYLSKYCHYCKENGHIENICPLVQKALKKSKGRQTIVSPKIHTKNNLSSATMSKVKDFRKLQKCTFCGNSDHKEDDCAEKNQYIKKHELNFKEQVQLKDMCPSLEKDVRKLENENPKFYLNGQIKTSNSNKYKYKKTLNKCNFCENSDHSESECEEKLQYEYIGKYCHYCEEYGHFEDTCPLVEEAAREMENESCYEVSPKSSKKVNFVNDVTILTENLDDLKICHICDEFGHNEDNCFVKEQAEFYSKYCDRCDKNGHEAKDCKLKNELSKNSTVSSNILKRELEFKTSVAYSSICSDHYMCDSCHNVYSEKDNSASKGLTSKNIRKTTFQSSFEAKAYRLRYCTLCGIEGLIDTCFLKERAATE